MNIQLTKDEINILIDAVKSWEKEPSTEANMHGMFTDLFEVINPENRGMSREQLRESMSRKRRAENDKVEAIMSLRRETSVLLQAKLIQARLEQTF